MKLRAFVTVATAVMLLGVCLQPRAHAQVIGLQPTPFDFYYWNSSTQAWTACPNNGYSLFPQQSTPQAVAPYGLNAGEGQWTPFAGVGACPGGSGSGGITQIIGSNGPITCTDGSCNITGQSLDIEHNGAQVPDQTTLNFLDAPPSIPGGYVPVVWGTNSGGGLGGWVPPYPTTTSAGLQFQITPPHDGQYVIVYPSTAAPGATSGFTAVGFANATTGAGGNVGGGPLAICAGPISGSASVTWGGYALPSYVLAANVTEVDAFAISQSGALVPSGGCDSISYTTNGNFITTITTTGTGISGTEPHAFRRVRVTPGGCSR